MKRVLRALWRWAPPAAWAGLIAWLSHQPSVPTPSIPHLDKAFHAAEFAVLALLLRRAMSGTPSPRRWWIVATACAAFAAADEWHQSFVPGRYCDPADFVADLAGVVLAWSTLRLLPPLRRITG